jgi:GH24 family phage-related lysozyme (muramidase)
MKTSTAGINLIKQFEGCRLTAYKPVKEEKYWTIGYGHYGQDVTPGMTITQNQAEIMLGIDLVKYELSVEHNAIFPLSQNQFDALVSFAYNCGVGNLQKLLKGRSAPQVAEAMLRYNKGSGKVLPGLVKRRQAEHDLFCKDIVMPATGNPYSEPTKAVRYNSKGNDVRWLQYELNRVGGYKLIVDGIAGKNTIVALKDFQEKHNLEPDGICGQKTRAALKQAQ